MTVETSGTLTKAQALELAKVVDDKIGVDYEINEYATNEYGLVVFDVEDMKEMHIIRDAEIEIKDKL